MRGRAFMMACLVMVVRLTVVTMPAPVILKVILDEK